MQNSSCLASSDIGSQVQTMARLISSHSRTCYCLAGVGENKDWEIPCDLEKQFSLQFFIGRKLLKLKQDEQGNCHPCKGKIDECKESSALVSGFIGKNHEVRVIGSLRDFMDEDGWAKVSFRETPLRECSYEAELIDISRVSTAPMPKQC